DEADFDRTAAALAAGRDYLDSLDVALLDEKALEALGIAVSAKTLGVTPDDKVNQVHREFVEMTVDKVTALVDVVAKSSQTRVPRARIKQLVRYGIEAGDIDVGRVKDSLLAEVRT
ncbi:MAG: hypothetical protein IIC31_11210, partial [Chloroflexi bacterium]|nr:hypothetical protein [Chloroflexota bacterium]